MNENIVDKFCKVDDFNICGFFNEYRFLSNFYNSSVWFEGLYYASSENAYQAAKVEVEFRDNFLNCSSSSSKKIWKDFPKLYTEDEWNNKKFNIMFRILCEKFFTNAVLYEKLLSTGTKYLEETNWWGDTYWGVCQGRGKNNLGKLLMYIRASQDPDFCSDKIKLI